jgi:pyrrolysine biosynthesis protein PylC
MKVAIIGGKLQGLEAAYLAGKADWDVTIIDRVPDIPAAGLCQEFLLADITTQTNLKRFLQPFDMVIPALEDHDALKCLQNYAQIDRTGILFDFDAYAITASKIDSDKLLSGIHIPTPSAYLDNGFPVIVKPSKGSGSRGICVIHNSKQLASHLAAEPGEQVIQKFVYGPSYSLEIIGHPGNYCPLQVTELEMDPVFDCKRVIAPSGLSQKMIAAFEHIAVTTADTLKLKGLMDVEVILDDDVLRVLEIDARFPSQTPITVLTSTGVNMLRLLAERHNRPLHETTGIPVVQRGVVFEHIRVSGSTLAVTGEHAMASAGPLHLEKDFFGADEAITCQWENQTDWVASLIISAEDRTAAWEKRGAVIAEIMRFFNLDTYRDRAPIPHDVGRQSLSFKGSFK